MSQYYIVSEEMKKAKRRKQNFAIHKELQELAKDIKDLKEKYRDNVFAMSALKEFWKILENADIKKENNKSAGFLGGLARKLGIGKNAASANSPNGVAGVRG